MTAKVTAITALVGTTRRTTFQIVKNTPLTVPTVYLASLNGVNTLGTAFASINTSALTINPPAAISLAPNSSLPGQKVTVTIKGMFSNFFQGSSQATFGAGVSVGGGASGGAGPITVSSPTSATAQLSIDPTASIGPRDVSVVTGSEVALLTGGFTVTGPPVLTQVNPNTGQQGQQKLSVDITGQFTNFAQSTSQVDFGTKITIVSLTVKSTTTATAVITIDPAAPTGPRTVTMTTGTEVATLANGFTVTTGAPALLSVDPKTGQQGQQQLPVTLIGQFTHFQQGSSQASFGGGITIASLTVNSSTSVTAILNIATGAAIGARTVTVTTGGEMVALTNGFMVTSSTPITLSVNPNNGQQGRQNLSVTLSGQSSHFLQGISQADFGAGTTVTALTIQSATSATAILNIDPTAATGPRPVTLSTGGEVGTLSNGFTVTPGTPTLLTVIPNSGQVGQQNLVVIVTGQFTHFAQGMSQANFGAGITVASLVVSSLTSATATLNIDSGAAIGSRTVSVTTGSEVATLSNGFTVTPIGPTLVSVNPNSGQQGKQSLPVIINGQFTHFLQGTSQVTFGAGITVASLTVNSPTSAAATLNIDYSATPGPRNVTLTTGTEVAALTNGFNVTAPPSILQSVNPNSGGQGQQGLSVNIIGQFTHFLQGTSQASFGAGISVASLTVNSFTSATAILNIDSAATTGARSVTVSTGTETETLANGFTVTSQSIGITVTPSPLAFGGVPISTSSKKTVTITSTGQNPLTVNSISLNGAFFVMSGVPSIPLVLPPSGSASFFVTYAPLGTISSSATLTVGSNSATSLTSITLSGNGTPPESPAATGITVTTDQSAYHRGQPVQISGTLTSAGNAGIPNIPVTLQISSNGSNRSFNPFTDAQGNFHTTFRPNATDGGTFSVTATATSGGATQTATTSFRIFGLLISPASLSQDLVMGSTLPIPLSLQNVGDASLNNVTYSANVTPAGALTVGFPQSIPTLGSGALVTVPVVLTAPSGNPPPMPVTVTVTVTSTDSVSGGADPENSIFTITLRPAISTLALVPPSLSVGVNPGGSLTRRFLVQNNGYAPTNNSTVTLQDPATFNWVSLGNANLGNLAAGASQEFQVLINPPTTLPLGNYTVLFNVSGGTNPLQGTLNIAVTQSTLGAVAFTVSDDTGAKVGGATVTLYGKTNGKSYQGVTGANGQDTITGVDAGDYSYVVAAASHDPGSGSVTITAGATAQVNVLLVYDVVSLTFTVTPTTIVDQYTVTLSITYSTTLPKPALKVVPPNFDFSFFPADVPDGKFPCSLSITNSHPSLPVRNVTVDTSQLDVGQPSGQQIHVQFSDGTALYSAGTLAPQASTTVACFATVDGNDVPTHPAGSIVVQGNYDFALDGNVTQGTTTTNVPVSYIRPSDLNYIPIPFIYDLTDPTNPVLTYNGGSFVQTVTSERPEVFNLSQPTGSPFGGHNLVAFIAPQDATSALDAINTNQGNAFWHSDFNSQKQSLLGTGDTTTFDITTPDNGVTLAQALSAQIAANPVQALTLPSYLGFSGQWTDRAAPNGYLIPIRVMTVTPTTISTPGPGTSGTLQCLNPEDPGCQEPTPELLPPDITADGQVQIVIDQKIRLERQAFNAMLGIGAQAVLNNTVATIQILDSTGKDASSNFFVLVTSDPLGATHGGTVSGQASVAWQLIPNAGAGGTSPQGTRYQVQATLSYVVNGTSKSTVTKPVTITVLPSPKLTVAYTAPFVVVDGKDAKIRVTVQNIGAGIAHNLSIQSAQPMIAAGIQVDPNIPNLLVDFNITGSSNTSDSSGFQPGNLTINFGDVAPGATVSGYWTLRVSRRGFFISFSSTLTHQDYQGVQLDPLVLPPTTTLVPAIGGMVTNGTGLILPNLTVSIIKGTTTVGTDQTDATTGEYYIQDLSAGADTVQVTDISNNVLASQNVALLPNQPTSFIDFVIQGAGPKTPATVTLDASGLFQTYNGAPKVVTATTNPPGLTVNFTYNGAPGAPATAGTYGVTATINDPSFQGATTGTLTIGRATPVITWPPPTAIVYGTPLSSTQLDASAAVGGVPTTTPTTMPAFAGRRMAMSSAPVGAYATNSATTTDSRDAQPRSTGNSIAQPKPTNVAFSSDRTGRFQIWAYQDNLSLPIQVTFGGGGNQESRNAAWSVAKGKIAYQFGAPGVRGIHVINPDGSADTKVTPDYPSTPNYPCQDARDPTWSPDGRYIAYACLAIPSGGSPAGGNYQIWVHDNTGPPNSLASESLLVGSPQLSAPPILLLNPAWSPDGNSIAFVTAGLGGKSKISVVNVSVGVNACVLNQCGVVAMTNADASVSNPTWSPDSSEIAFSSTTSGGHHIYTMSAQCPETNNACAPAQQVTFGGGSDTYPSWSTDGPLVFVSNRITNQNPSGKTQLYVIDPSQPESVNNTATAISDGTANDDDSAFGPGAVLGIDISLFETNCPNPPTSDPSINPDGTCPDKSGKTVQLESLTPEYWAAVKAAGVKIAVVETYGSNTQAANAWKALSLANQAGLQTAIYCLLDFTQSGAANINNRCLTSEVVPVGLPLSFVALDIEPPSVGVAFNGNSGKPPNSCSPCVPSSQVVTVIEEAIGTLIQANQTPLIYTLNTDGSSSGIPPGTWDAMTGGTDAISQLGVRLWDTRTDGCPDLAHNYNQPPPFCQTVDTTTHPWPGPGSGQGNGYGGWTRRVGKQFLQSTEAIPVTILGTVTPIDLDVFDSSILSIAVPTVTPVGPNVKVQPLAPTGVSPVTMVIGKVISAGVSALNISANGPALPLGFSPGSPSVYFNISTTAVFSGLVQVCIDFQGTSLINPANARLFHFVANAWSDVTGSVNTSNSTICGSVTSLSPFVILEPSSAPVTASGNFVYNPPAGTVLNAGTETLSVTFFPTDTTNYTTASATVTLQVNQAPATVTLNPTSISQTFDGTPKSVAVTTEPPNLKSSVTYTQNGSAVTAPTNAGSYNVTVVITDQNYVGSATGTLIITGTGACDSAPTGLVSWWAGNGNTSDSLGVNNPSASNAVTFVPGEVATGFTFGPGGFIDIPASPSLENPQFTWSAWARPDGPGPNNDSFGNVIVGQNIDNTHTSVQLLWRPTDNRFVFLFGDISSDLIVSTDSFAPGQFYLVTGTYDGATFKLFVNGASEGQFSLAKTVAYSSLTWTIGSTGSTLRTSFPRTWNGVIDEVLAFNRALSQAEIQAIFNAAGGGECIGQGAVGSVSPNTAEPGQQNFSVAIAGRFTQWLQGTTTASFGPGITVVSLTVNSVTNATALVNIDSAAATGPRTVTMTTGNEVETLPSGFTVAVLPDLTISKTHSGSFMQGDTGDTYTITVSNNGAAPTIGVITVTDTLPTGLAATAISGTGWTCPAGTLTNPVTCTRSDPLAAGSSYPVITLTVSVASNALASVTNTVTVSGGGELNTENDAASDPTPIIQIQTCVTAPSGLVSWLPGDGNANDIAGGNDGTPVGGASFAAGEVGQAFSFNGTTSFVNLGNPASIGIQGPITVAAWVKPNVLNNFAVLFDQMSASNTLGEVQIRINPSGTFDFFRRESQGSISVRGTSSQTIAIAGVWQHVVAVYDGSGYKIYVNGLLDTGGGPGTSAVNSQVNTAVAPGTVIGTNKETSAEAFSGLMDEVQIFNRALAGSEIQAMFSAGSAGECKGSGAAPDLVISKTHAANFSPGQTGAAYTIIVTNGGGSSTTGQVTVSDAVPGGLSATAINGAGWTCPTGTLTSPVSCTRSDPLSAGASYPPIILTVTVATNAPASVTNTAAVSGGGELNTTNDSASDVTAIGPVGCLAPPSGLSDWWPADGNAQDISGGNNGSLVGGTTFATGIVGEAFSFNGNNQYVDVGGLNLPTTFTIAAWINPNSISNGPEIFSKDDGVSSRSYFFQVEAAGTLVASVRNTGGGFTQYRTSTPVITAGVWQHIAVTYDGNAGISQKMEFYQNGNSAPVSVIGSYDFGGTPETDSLSTKIGIFGDGVSNAFSGLIDEVQVFNRVLTPTEIQAISAGECKGTPASPDLMISSTHSGVFATGQLGVAYMLTIGNAGGTPTSGNVTVIDTLPSSLTATAISGIGWTCPTGTLTSPITCTRSDPLLGGASYPPITLTVSVANNAPASLTNVATVSGGGETNTSNDTANDATTITQAPDLTVSKTHTGNFTQGQNGAQYTITVNNIGGSPTSGQISLTDTLPLGLTATAISGTGWTCPTGVLASPITCTRSDALAAAASYPSITLTVTVASDAPSSATNSATVSGGGELNIANDTASDATTITPTAACVVPPSGIVGWWTGDGNANDIVSGNNGTLFGGATFAPGMVGQAFSFNGTNSYVEVPGSSNLDITGPLTIDGWIRLNSAGKAQYIVIKDSETDNGNFHNYQLSVQDDNSLFFDIGTGTTQHRLSSTTTLAAGIWYHVAAVYDGSNQIIYINGSQDAVGVIGSQVLFTTPTKPLRIGIAEEEGTFLTPFDGFIDELQLFNRGLAPSEIQAIFNAGSAGECKTSSTQPDLTISKSHVGSFVQGQTGAAYTIAVSNVGGTATIGQVTVTDTLPTGLTATAINATGWTCVLGTLTCTRSDTLVAGASYPSITLTANVANIAPASLTNIATVSGGGEANISNDTANDLTTVTQVADLTVSKTHAGNFTQGQSGAQYTITVNNVGGTATAGQVNLTDTLPTGLTATAISGTGWTCPTGTLSSLLTCTRSDALAAGSSYPVIILTVNVATNAPGSLTNVAAVSGGGESNTSNDSASDPTTINPITGSIAFTEYPVPSAGSDPTGITAGPDGNLWFAELLGNKIGKITTGGQITEFSVPNPGGRLNNIASGADGNLWFTQYFAGDNIWKVTTDGVFNQFPLPTGSFAVGITAGPDGNLWFTEGSRNNIGRITPAGGITEFPVLTANSQPEFIATGPDGNLWFTEYNAQKIGTITPAGAVAEFAVPGSNLSVYNLAGGPDGNVWFTELVGNKIERITPDGAITQFPASRTTSITTGPDGNLWFTEETANNIARITPAGVITEFPVPTANSSPEIITVGPDGNLWFTEASGNKIAKADIGFSTVPPDLTIRKTHSGNFIQGQTGAAYTISVGNGGGIATTGQVTVSDTLPAGLSATSISGAGWTCPTGTLTNSITCTRSDLLLGGASYPALILTVTVANNAPAALTNTVMVSGGGETNTSNDTFNDVTTIISNLADLTVTETHSGSFLPGQSGALYMITVTNQGGAPTNGQVSLTDVLPAGLAAMTISGTGWTCPTGTLTSPLTCTRSDALASGASYPPVTLTVIVADDAPASVTNTVTVSGGGEQNTTNDSVSDVTSTVQNIPMETESVAFSVLNAPVTGAGIIEAESIAFSLLNAPVTGAGILETESVAFSVLNAPITGAGILETESVAFSLLNAPAGTAGITETESPFYSVLNNFSGAINKPAATSAKSGAESDHPSPVKPEAPAPLETIDPFLDSDGDGLPDWFEELIGTDPFSPDMDGDGLSDFEEIFTYHTDPLNSDTDGDGFSDGIEVLFGSDPLDPLSTPLFAGHPAGVAQQSNTDFVAVAANNGTNKNSAVTGEAHVKARSRKPSHEKVSSAGSVFGSFVPRGAN